MNNINTLIKELCPSGIKFEKISHRFTRLKGTKITATEMKQIESNEGEITVIAGGKNLIKTHKDKIPNARVIYEPSVVIQSRGNIDFIYIDTPFTFKNEMWAYTTKNQIETKFLYYYLCNNIDYFRHNASKMGSMPQISLPITEDFLIPVLPLKIQEKIVTILDVFKNMEAELEARKKQFEYYRNSIFSDLNSYPKL